MGHWTFIFALWIVQIHFYFFTPPSSDHKQKTEPSPAGNRTPVSRVTGGDTDHYTTEEYTNTRAATRAKVPKCHTLLKHFAARRKTKLVPRVRFELTAFRL